MEDVRPGGVAVVIPTYNEVESIVPVLEEIPGDIVDWIIVVDGGSADGTQEAARRSGAQVIAVGRGYGLACLVGGASR